jgi:hypothetical protein
MYRTCFISKIFNDSISLSMLRTDVITGALSVLRLQVEQRASRYGGQLQI